MDAIWEVFGHLFSPQKVPQRVPREAHWLGVALVWGTGLLDTKIVVGVGLTLGSKVGPKEGISLKNI